MVQPLRDSVALARFPGRGLGYAAVAEIPATTLLFQERPLTIADTFADAEEARRALARAMAANSLRDREGGVGAGGGPVALAEPSQLREHLNGTSIATVFEPSPFKDEGIDDESWNDALHRARRDARVRRAKKGEADRSVAAAALRGENGTNPNVVDSDFGGVEKTTDEKRSFETTRVKETASEEGVYVARIAAHVSRLNHSCRPNAAVSAGDGVTTVYSLRAIAPGEEICVSYASNFLWLPVHARRAQLAKRWGFLARARAATRSPRAAAGANGAGRAQASRFGARRAGGVDSRAAREAERDAGFRAWEYGETGFENQFDDEGELRSEARARSEGLAKDLRIRDARETRDRVSASDSSDSDSSTSDSSDSDYSDEYVDPGEPASRRSVGSNGSWRKRGAIKKKRGGAVVGAARLYVKLSRAGIGRYWQMPQRELVSKLLSAEGRKDFDLDLLLEHAQCAARLAPNHPHFVRLVTLVEEVFKSNRDVIVAEQFWVWTIELLREAVHPDVLFWNTEFKGMPGYRAVEEDVRTNAR